MPYFNVITSLASLYATPDVISSGSGPNSLQISPIPCQNHVQTEACGAEWPFRSWEEHPAEAADEGT